jgi:hypothetical protein
MRNTGEHTNQFMPFDTYKYGSIMDIRSKLYRPGPGLRYECDNVNNDPHSHDFILGGVLIDVGCSKSLKLRQEMVRRRQKAWAQGLWRTRGHHLLEGTKRNWMWTKEELVNIEKSEYGMYLDNLKEFHRKYTAS